MPAIFLDRDGTIIREVGYLSRLADLEVLPGVARALRRLGEAGFVRVVVTNQSGVARGLFERSFVEETHAELRRRLDEAGADIDAFYVCPHHPEFDGPCECRKPVPGLVRLAARDLGLDVSASWVIGDKVADVELGRRAGCRTCLVRTGYGRKSEAALTGSGLAPDLVADDLEVGADEILRRTSTGGLT